MTCRVALLLLACLLALPALSAETWYLRNGTGPACGDGDREDQSQTAGSSLATKALDGTGDSWGRSESRTFDAGTWEVCVDITTGSGGGPQNRVSIVLRQVSSICSILTTIINTTVDTNKGTTEEHCVSSTGGSLSFSAGDILTLELTDANGNQTKTVRYNNTAGGDADSRINHPDETGGAGDQLMVM